MIGVLDETTPQVGGAVWYTLVSGLIIEDEEAARRELGRVVPGRKRPFHWHREGPAARSAMVSCLTAIEVLGSAIVTPGGRRGQEAARARAMRACLEELLDNGCSAAIIETRTSRQDATDRGVILDLLRERPAAINFSYRWGTKAEPLLWIADAIGGAVREHLIGEQVGWYDKVAAATGLEVRYI